MRGRGAAPHMHYAPSYDYGYYDDGSYYDDSYMDQSYYGEEQYVDGSYDSFAAGMAEGLAAGMAMARKQSALGRSRGGRRPRGRGLGSRGATTGRNMGAAMRGMGYGGGGYW